MPYAVRFDAPALLNRPGARNALLRAARAARDAACPRHDPVQRGGCRGPPRRGGAARSWCRPRSTRPRRPPSRRSASGSPSRTSRTRRRRDSTWWSAAGRPRASDGARLEVYGLDPDWARVASAPHRGGRAGLARAARHRRGDRVPRAPAARPRLRPRRALGGLGPGAARGAGGRRAPGDRALRRPLRGPAARAAARAGARGRRHRRRGAGPRRSARRSSCPRSARTPTASGPPELLRPYGSEAVQETVTRELLPALLG